MHPGARLGDGGDQRLALGLGALVVADEVGELGHREPAHGRAHHQRSRARGPVRAVGEGQVGRVQEERLVAARHAQVRAAHAQRAGGERDLRGGGKREQRGERGGAREGPDLGSHRFRDGAGG